MAETLKRIAQLLEDGDGPDLDDLLNDRHNFWTMPTDRVHLETIVRWARLPATPATAAQKMGRQE